jgi:hypothetical protein
MSAYRIYELTADNHVAAPPTIVDCPDDIAAIERARQRLDRHRIIEVWQVDRCVIRMQPIAERRRHGGFAGGAARLVLMFTKRRVPLRS